MMPRNYEIAVCAVSYDALFVSDLIARLRPSLVGDVYWHDGAEHSSADLDHADVVARSARVVIVLHQELWGRHGHTTRDVPALQARVQQLPADATCVVRLDHTPVPEWLESVPACSLAEAGVEGVASFIAAKLGVVPDRATAESAPEPEAVQVERPMWSEGGQPFLAQSRAMTTLRHELDALNVELARRVRDESGRVVDGGVDLHSTPQRTVVQLGRVGLSYSWVAGRSGTIADGRLLVIEWDGVVAYSRRVVNAQAASPSRERVFRPKASGPNDWRWCEEDADHVAYSTRHLAGQTFDGALLALGG